MREFDCNTNLIDSAGLIQQCSVNILTSRAINSLQRIPISMRRRAASHDIRRLPMRFRKQPIVQSARKKVRRCRKFRRRHMTLQDVLQKHQGDTKRWMFTHLWHARRFRVETHWGWRVPMNPNFKSFRPSMRKMRRDCCVMDMSYLRAVQLGGRLDDLMTLLSRVIQRPEEVAAALKQDRELYLALYRPDEYPRGFLAPVRFLWLPEQGETGSLVVTVHPAAAEAVFELLAELYGREISPLSVARFRLLGPRSKAALSSLPLHCTDLLSDTLCLSFSNQLGGMDLLLAPCLARPLWHKLNTQQHCLPIGWTLHCRQLSLETDSVMPYLHDCFPDMGAPDSAICETQAQLASTALEAKWNRKPARNRINYSLAGCRSPFKCDWSWLWSIVFPQQNQEEEREKPDWIVCRDRTLLHRAVRRIVSGEVSVPERGRLKPEERCMLLPVTLDVNEGGALCARGVILGSITQSADDDAVLGLVETGDQCFTSGKARGRGMVSLQRLAELRPLLPNVWVRNPNSATLVFAKMSLSVSHIHTHVPEQ